MEECQLIRDPRSGTCSLVAVFVVFYYLFFPISILSKFFSHNHTLNRQIIPGAPLTHFNEVGEGGGGGGGSELFFWV